MSNYTKEPNPFLLFIAVAIAAVIILIIIISPAFLFADELYNYKIYGQNKETGLVVAGHVWEADKNGSLVAKIYDKMEIVDQCFGQWVGYGVAEIKCENGHTYVVEVVED